MSVYQPEVIIPNISKYDFVGFWLPKSMQGFVECLVLVGNGVEDNFDYGTYAR